MNHVVKGVVGVAVLIAAGWIAAPQANAGGYGYGHVHGGLHVHRGYRGLGIGHFGLGHTHVRSYYGGGRYYGGYAPYRSGYRGVYGISPYGHRSGYGSYGYRGGSCGY